MYRANGIGGVDFIFRCCVNADRRPRDTTQTKVREACLANPSDFTIPFFGYYLDSIFCTSVEYWISTYGGFYQTPEGLRHVATSRLVSGTGGNSIRYVLLPLQFYS
jgi:hypothetical protein